MRSDEHVIAQLDIRARHRGRAQHGMLRHDRVRADLDPSALRIQHGPVHDACVRTHPHVADQGGVGRDVRGWLHDRRRAPVFDQHGPDRRPETAKTLA